MTWQPSYCTAADLAGWLGIDETPELALATEAASRAIDKSTGRQFGIVVPESRVYQAEYWRGKTLVDIDDLMTADDLVIEVDGNAVSEYVLLPRNASQKSRPWTSVEIPGAVHGRVTITAQWGWSAVPDAIRFACLIQAARFYERRANPAGQKSQERVDDVQLWWTAAAQDLETDVLASIAPYRRSWAAA
jgi:hypothetical protein